MLVNLVEIYEDRSFTELEKRKEHALSLREVSINPDHVIYLRENEVMEKKILTSNLFSELDDRQQFTTIHINKGLTGLNLIVIGSLSAIEGKLNLKKQLLKG